MSRVPQDEHRGSEADLPFTTAPSPDERAALHRARTALLPLLLVLVSLTLALVVPRLAERRVDRLREEINAVAEPARARLAEIRLDLALEAAARRGYLLTGEPQFARDLAASRARRSEAERRLALLAPRLDPPVPARLRMLEGSIDAIDVYLDSVVTGSAARAVYAEQRQEFDDALAAASDLSETIERSADLRRERIRAIERDVAVVTAALVLLGLGAALLVALLGTRHRRLALRLAESEARAREVARAAEERRLALERVTESRTRLIRGFTHDVKNPLGAADGFLALLEDGVHGGLAEPQRGALAKARRSIRHALELITQQLELARAEAGQLEVRRRELDVAALVGEVADAYRAQAEAKGLALELALPPALPAVQSDPTRVRQVLGNLVSNAVKYTPPGGCVRIHADAASGRGDGRARELAIEVSDDGPGIPRDRVRMLFDEFTRLDPDAAEGAGIGLAISRRIAEALGGEITVESEEGRGSTFRLRLPLDGAARAT